MPDVVGQCPAPEWASGKPAEDAARLPSNAGLIDNRERGRFLLEIAPALTAWGDRVCWEKWKVNLGHMAANPGIHGAGRGRGRGKEGLRCTRVSVVKFVLTELT